MVRKVKEKNMEDEVEKVQPPDAAEEAAPVEENAMIIDTAVELETLRQEYVVTARAKGLKEKDVINGHARPNALIPVATLSGFTVAGLLGGAVMTETIFDYPGIGQAAGAAAQQLDVIAVLSFTLLSGFILIVANLIVDVMYAFLDPRVRLN